MVLPEIEIGVWLLPHRSYGYLIEIDAAGFEDEVPTGVVQSLESVPMRGLYPEFLPDFPHTDFKVEPEQMSRLVELTDQITYSFREHPFTPMLGGAHFGLRIARGHQRASVVWLGRFEDQDEPIRALYSAVLELGKAACSEL
ncbi:hypothetical protein OOT46_24685 [Aquabacterium sp. A7-Y]|uniref:hypothetical protein n=1 Tax=Aquabacterium sp. A7-Y TaxID=1349605 RepID=UPI00223E67F6|nr:hypothetical protein [Aquabacterium sp. A7-Y]MCW7541023.1 hypothetical protein [Aquabacterium sp. A7-Y]